MITVFERGSVAGVPAALTGRVAAVVAEMIGHLHLQPRSKTALIIRLISPSGPSIANPGRLGVGKQRIDLGRLEQLSQPPSRQILCHRSTAPGSPIQSAHPVLTQRCFLP